MFPAVFEGGNRSRILPAVEGLVFPLYLGFVDELRERYPDLFAKLGEHLRHALCSGVCLDAKTGAWKVSSTSANTWFSKIALSQHVSRQVFPDSLGREALHADRVHATMQQAAPLGRFAMVDQVHAQTGEPLGSRYYPRVVTACLWLRER
jgi:xylan 1,4-beta-xylosidase